MKIPSTLVNGAGVFVKGATQQIAKQGGRQVASSLLSSVQNFNSSQPSTGKGFSALSDLQSSLKNQPGGQGPASSNNISMSDLEGALAKLPSGTLKAAIEMIQKSGGRQIAAPASAEDNEEVAVINGDATDGPQATDHAPAGYDLAKIKSLDGGLLGETGNQELRGAGADKIQGSHHIMDIVAKRAAGPDARASDTDGPDTQAKDDEAWKELKYLEEAKNAPQANGKQADADTRHNGNMSGLQPSLEVASNSDLAFVQNDGTKGGPSDKMDGNDGETTGAQQVGQQILNGLGTAADWIAKIGAKLAPEFAPLIKLVGDGVDVGLHAAGAAADGQDVGQAAAQSAEGMLDPLNLLM